MKSAAEYLKTLGWEVRVEEIESVVIGPVLEVIILDRDHGIYAIKDPFFHIWLAERHEIERECL